MKMYFLAPLMGCIVLASTGIAATPSGIYYGAAATLQQAETALTKTVESRFGGELTPSQTYQTSAVVDENQLQWDGLVGIRFPFAEATQFIAIQAEVSLVGDDVSGRLDGEGQSPGRNLFGEAWPEEWSLETSRSYGITGKYGIQRALFGVFDVSLYGLLGARQTELDFFSTFYGCFQQAGCSVDEFRTDVSHINPELTMFVAGAGIETNLGLKTAFQVEVRFVGEASSDWGTDFAEGEQAVSVPVELVQEGTDLSMKLIRYF